LTGHGNVADNDSGGRTAFEMLRSLWRQLFYSGAPSTAVSRGSIFLLLLYHPVISSSKSTLNRPSTCSTFGGSIRKSRRTDPRGILRRLTTPYLIICGCHRTIRRGLYSGTVHLHPLQQRHRQCAIVLERERERMRDRDGPTATSGAERKVIGSELSITLFKTAKRHSR
jgi:hypothetical protein